MRNHAADETDVVREDYIMYNLDNLKVAEVDCTQEPLLCGQQQVMGYPTIILYKDGTKHTDYQFNRDFDRYKFRKLSSSTSNA